MKCSQVSPAHVTEDKVDKETPVPSKSSQSPKSVTAQTNDK